MGKKQSNTLVTKVDNVLNDRLIVIRIEGVLDSFTSPDLEKKVFSLLSEKRNKLLINLEGIDYISSSGLRTFLTTSRKIDSLGGKFLLCSLSDNVLLTLKNSGFENFFVWKNTEEQALAILMES
jgi:anti-sigma B factor antagonist